MSRGELGTRTGGKGSWRRKAKKTPKNGNVEGQKVWQAGLRAGCRQFGELDSASIMIQDQKEVIHFTKPALAFNGHANTYMIMGVPAKKDMAEVVQDLLSGMDFSKFKAPEGEKAQDDIGDIPADVDFSKPESAEAPAE